MLNKKVAIYIPGTIDINKKISLAEHEKYIEKIAGIFSDCFGGASTQSICGFWKAKSGELVKENNTIVYAFCDKRRLYRNRNRILKLAEAMRNELSQEYISVEINNRLLFV